jgi:hypothetical protein
MSQTQGAPGSRISGAAVLGKRPPGRPKGYPRSGGRQKDVPPQTSAEMRERIIKQADPVGFLIQVAAGRVIETYDPTSKRKRKHAPTFEQRLEAAGKLVRKVLPDLNAVAATVDATVEHGLRPMFEDLSAEERDAVRRLVEEALEHACAANRLRKAS